MKKHYLLLLFILLIAFPANASAGAKIFGKNGKRSENIDMFPKWTKVVDKISSEMSSPSKKCKNNSKRFYCNIDEWISFLNSIKSRSKKEQLDLVNEFANEKKYILDNINWGMTDYWASPGEFLMKNGDCEDFAIIKYVSLIRLGFKKDDLRLVILNDNNLGIIHAVLSAKQGNNTYILDNQISKVTSHKRIFHYSPIFSINENAWWKYI